MSSTKPSISSTWRETTGSLRKSFVMKTSSNSIRILKPLSPPLYLSRPVIQKWTGEEYEDMEAEFDNIDENEGGMILFKV